MKKLFGLVFLFSSVLTANAIEPEDGKYVIRTAQDLKEYADFSQGGNFDVPVYFEADIDCSAYGENGIKMIGNWEKKFYGKIYGQGHRISNLRIVDNDHDNVGFISTGMSGAEIRDLILDKTCYFEGTEKVGAFMGRIGWNDARHIVFEGCGNEADVRATKGANAAAFVGCNTQGDGVIEMRYCWNTGNIYGPNENAAFCAWLGSGNSVVEYCWNTGRVENISTAGNSSSLIRKDGVTANHCFDFNTENENNKNQYTAGTFEESWIANGHLCYVLNEDQSDIHWYQNLTGEVDAYPVRFNDHAQVYANGTLKCDGSSAGGELTYGNSSNSVVPPHTNENGWCTVCGTFIKDHLTPTEGYYQIGTANDLRWFASYVMDVEATVKAKLTADIDYSNYKQGYIGVPGLPFKGEFDGQEHTITIDIVNNGKDVSRTGLFAAINGATIKNLVVEGAATSSDLNCVGGLGGRSDGTSTIENVIVKTAVSYTGENGDATCGGFFANMEATATLTNCAFLGSISTGEANGNGGLVGWAGSGANNKYTNCLVAPTAFDESKGDKFARNNPAKTNCYFVASDDARLASGELCYELNAKANGGEDWYQNLTGEIDATPVPFASHAKVYGNGRLHCDGTPHEDSQLTFGNTNEQVRDEHDVNGGFCNYCNIMTGYDENYMTPAGDGFYEITNNKQMRWFAAKVKTYRVASNEDSNARINARLMNDIDFDGVTDYQPIGGLWGQGNARYAGEFDGQFHKIANLHIDLDQDNVGIFGVIAEGADIKNLTVDSSCSIKGKAHVGIVGEAWRSHNGEFTLRCLGNEADITGTGNNVGGILGVNMNNGGYAKCNMIDCYSTGTIKGNAENGQLTGWSGDNAYLENCYAIGTIINGDGFGRLGGGSTNVNCYTDKNLTWNNHPTQIENGWLASGELCYRLGDVNFRQEIGEDAHPVLSDVKPNVFGVTVSDAGYATCVLKDNTDFTAWGVEAYKVATIEDGYVTLEAVTGGVANDAVIVKADEGVYFDNPAASATTVGDNELQSSAEPIEYDANADVTYYVLAKPAEKEIGFYPVGSGTIAVGKAFLTIAKPAGAKFLRIGGEGTTTAIEGVIVNKLDGTTEIYNLAGQKLMNVQKGINIIGGKKVLVK